VSSTEPTGAEGEPVVTFNRVSKRGGAITVLSQLLRVPSIYNSQAPFAIDGTHAFINDGGSLFVLPKSGGTLLPLFEHAADGPQVRWFVLASDSVYWVDDFRSGVHRIAKAGGPSTDFRLEIREPLWIATYGGDYFYWTIQEANLEFTLYRASLSNGDAEIVARSADSTPLVTATDIFFGTPKLIRQPLNGGPQVVLSEEKVSGYRVDEEFCYWFAPDEPEMPNGQIRLLLKRVRLDGSSSIVLARDLPMSGMVIDSTHVYWVELRGFGGNDVSAAIMKLPKR